MRSSGLLLLLTLGHHGPWAQLGHRDLAQVNGKAQRRCVYVHGRIVELDVAWAARLGVIDHVLMKLVAQHVCVHLCSTTCSTRGTSAGEAEQTVMNSIASTTRRPSAYSP